MRAAFALAALFVLSAGAAATAADLTNREACLANGNTAEACACLENYVREKTAKANGPSATVEAVKRGAPTPGSSGDDLSAMGLVMQATSEGARKCNVKSKK